MRIFVCFMIVFFSGCRTPGSDSGSELDNFEFTSCPEQRGLSLVGEVDREKLKRKFSDLKVLTGQCADAARISVDGLVKQKAFVCYCVQASIDAFLFAENAKKDQSLSGDESECLRHVSWQARISCKWGSQPAKVLGDVRESGTEKSRDSIRDQYHNGLGRLFAKKAEDSGARCKKTAESSALFILKKDLCAKVDKQSKNWRFASSDEQEKAADEYSQEF
jgi:hypothetical protein